eukprot:14440600-Ditylum_brightwellii.AAC.1
MEEEEPPPPLLTQADPEGKNEEKTETIPETRQNQVDVKTVQQEEEEGKLSTPKQDKEEH